MGNEIGYLVVVALLVGLFGCCCVCYDVDVVLAAGKKDAYGLNANSGDVNFYAAVVADVGAVVVAAAGLCYEGNMMKKLMKDYLKNLRNCWNSTKTLMNSMNFLPSLVSCDVDYKHFRCYQLPHYCVLNGGVVAF
jgi:hypothetical protein